MQTELLGYILNISITRKPDTIATGITNETEDNYFLPFIDYDDILLSKVLKDIQHLRAVFGLGTCIILSTKQEKINRETKGNYHLVFFDKLPHYMIQKIICHTHADPLYSKAWRMTHQKNWVLRIGKKGTRNCPELAARLEHSSEHEKSSAHISFFEKLYGIRIRANNRDSSESLELITYQTRTD